MKKINGYIHMSINIRGLLNYFKHKSMTGFFIGKGRYMSDE